MKITFLRHGQSMGNLTSDYSTSRHGRLSDNGSKQAEEVIKRLANYQFDRIFVSPIERTRHTILPYLKYCGLKGELWSELAEGCWQPREDGPFVTDIPYERLVDLPPEELEVFSFKDKVQPVYFPQEETYIQALTRIKKVYDTLMSEFDNSDTHILLVGHGLAGSRLLEMLLQIEPLGRFKHDNAALSHVEQRADGQFLVRYINRI